MSKTKKKTTEWERFEHRVEQVLTLSGYEVEHDILLGGGQTDLLAINKAGPLTTRLLIECKYSGSDKKVSINDVENFISRIIVLRTQDLVDAGILVTNTSFTRNAKALLKHKFVELLNLEELYWKIYDFRPYLLSLIDSFEKSKLNDVFIKPYMIALDKSPEYEREITYFSDLKKSSQSIDIINYVDTWLKGNEGGRICLFGDYGSGKTSFCQWYSSHQAQKHLKNPTKEKILLFIPLNKFTKAINIDTLITDFVVNDCQISNFRLASFMFLLETGRYLLLLDGFDEMARHVDKDVRYQTISELSKLAKGKSKLILTGRPGYFPTHEELLHLIAGQEQTDLVNIARDAYNELVDYEPYEIRAFTINQISKYIRSYIKDKKESDKILSFIRNTYNLIDLATRPVLLEMIVKSLPKLFTLRDESTVNSAKLYEVYTDLWIDREEKKGTFRKLIRKDDKLKFMEELAFQMFTEDKNALTYKQLDPHIYKFFNIDDIELDYFAHDIRTCSFLFRVPRQGYIFAHRSFQEYFSAKKIISDATKNVKNSLEIRYLPKEIIKFASEMITNEKKDIINILINWASNSPDSICGINALTIALLSNAVIHDEILDMYDMPVHILRSYAAMKIDDQKKSHDFWTYLYKVGSKFTLSSNYNDSKIDQIDILHECFFRLIKNLKQEPLLKFEKIYAMFRFFLKTTESDIVRANYRRENNEIAFDDIISDLKHDGYEEDSLFLSQRFMDPFDITANRELWDILRETVSEEEYMLLRSHYFDGKSIVLLSKEMGVSSNAIRSRLYRLRKKIKNEFKSKI